MLIGGRLLFPCVKLDAAISAPLVRGAVANGDWGVVEHCVVPRTRNARPYGKSDGVCVGATLAVARR